MYILKNGTIIDGTGSQQFAGTIVVDQDRIIDVLQEHEAYSYQGIEIDCRGKVIAPGFIDAHTHQDFFAVKENNHRYFEPFIRQGVTTMIAGNCGFSVTGFHQDSPYQHLVGGGLFAGGKKSLPNFSDFSKEVKRLSPVNIASFVGHSTARISVNGNDGKELTPAQLQEMLAIMEDAMNQGALGVSLGLMYVPSKYAPYSELLEIAKLVQKKNKILSIHARACSKVSTSYSPPIGGRAHNLRALDEVIALAKDTGVKIQLSHLIFVGEKSWSTVEESLRLIDEANAQGCQIGFDMYAMDFGASIITVVLPSWYLLQDEKKKQSCLSKLRLAIELYVSIKSLGFGFGDILISNTKGLLPEVEGKRIDQIAKEWKMSSRKAYLKVAKETQYNASVLMYKYANSEIIERLRKHPKVLYMSDAWIEEQGVQNFAVYYNFVKFILLAKRQGDSIETAISKMTGNTAKWFSLQKQGLLKKGYFANITILDLDNLDYQEEKELAPTGIESVMINGQWVIQQGQFDTKQQSVSGTLLI